jgi:hypothetical protein
VKVLRNNEDVSIQYPPQFLSLRFFRMFVVYLLPCAVRMILHFRR